MNEIKEKSEFSILGQKVKMGNALGDSEITPVEILDYVNSEADKLRASCPGLSDHQLAVLTALQIASEKLSLSESYREKFGELRTATFDALKCIEEVSPSSQL
jgi:cell division protein ZapA (FtsZ GTPase activity inhibitor)